MENVIWWPTKILFNLTLVAVFVFCILFVILGSIWVIKVGFTEIFDINILENFDITEKLKNILNRIFKAEV